MEKISLNFSRTLTINTGNYESIKPNVSLSVHDVPVDKVADVYSSMQTIADVLMKFEIVQSSALAKEVNVDGYELFCRKVLSDSDELSRDIEDAISSLSNIK